MRVHPVAELFPMMSDEELQDLAADIKTNGQIHPIVTAMIDGQETLIDGRNRLRACEIAEVEPRKESLNGADPVAYILSTNDRRDMTQGQRAVVAALCHNLLQRGEASDLARSLKVPRQRVSEATIIVKHAPDDADKVRIGAKPFHVALDKARKNKSESEEQDKKLARLRSNAPDLAELVEEGRQPINEAEAAFEERRREQARIEENRRETFIRVVEGAYRNIIGLAVDDFVSELTQLMRDDPKFRAVLRDRARFNVDDLDAITSGAKNLVKLAKNSGG